MADIVNKEEQQRANNELWLRYVKDREPQVREQLILQYAPLVKYVMGRLAISLPAILDYEDVLSSGTIGLIEAVERYEPSKGVKFETYAIARVKGAIIDTLRSLDRLPRSVRQKAKAADSAVNALTVDLGREPTDQEVADALDLPRSDLSQAHRRRVVDHHLTGLDRRHGPGRRERARGGGDRRSGRRRHHAGPRAARADRGTGRGNSGAS